ncbi:MBL fold metallo-hydrolase [Rothia sp. LK2588]|uniref:MBL fold metallo-hydrolase n=1 Tax=Rothia sp. LK2588 TaxID=3114369 RepID=UPI0034CD19E4
MKLIKYSHSCVRLENNHHALVFDPGIFSESAEALESANYVVVTHNHPDHFDADTVVPYLAEHPQIKVFAPQPVADEIRKVAPDTEVTVLSGEEEVEVEGFSLKTFGGQHALIHPLVQTIPNVGVLVNDSVYHPGDSLVVPHGLQVKNLLVPIHAPWNKIQEVIDFIIAVGAPKAFPIHNALLSDAGHTIIEGQLKNFGSKYGTEYQHLETGDAEDLS